MQNLNCFQPAWGGVKIYNIHYKISVIITPPEEEWIFLKIQLIFWKYRKVINKIIFYPAWGGVDFFENTVDILKV